jgi:hypothetical protein
MTNQQHPITPPPELVEQWRHSWLPSHGEFVDYMITRAAQWGANQELEACCEWLQDPDLNVDTYKLRAARRPKPPSLKEQAFEAFEALIHGDASRLDVGVIRRVLEALPND